MPLTQPLSAFQRHTTRAAPLLFLGSSADVGFLTRYRRATVPLGKYCTWASLGIWVRLHIATFLLAFTGLNTLVDPAPDWHTTMTVHSIETRPLFFIILLF